MDSSPWTRVRWRNVARAALLLGAIALVVAWPRLGGSGTPALPAATAVPVGGGDEFGVEGAARRLGAPAVRSGRGERAARLTRRRRRDVRPPGRQSETTRTKRRHAHPHRRRGPAQAPDTVEPALRPPVSTWAPPATPPAAEFGVG